MNLTEVLNSALPDLSSAKARQRYPLLHPNLIWREEVTHGEKAFRAIVPGKSGVFFFTPQEWELMQLFDGKRSYEMIAEEYRQRTNIEYSVEQLRELASQYDAADFWYKSPQEQNILLSQKMAEERRSRAKKKSKFGDISYMVLSAWDPDNYLEKLLHRLGFMYTRWFTGVTLVAFGFMTYVFAAHWTEISADTIQFYNFGAKGVNDLALFWVLVAVILCVHESAHGLTCKHYGAHVHSMGFHLIYLTPAFYTDVSEGYVVGNRLQRMAMIASGAWSELLFCMVATPIWWLTPRGSEIHNAAYIVMLFTGLASIFINWNPLIKLDGYYLLAEITGINDLKESSTAFLSSWVKRYIWGLPVEVPFVPRRRRLPYAVYALCSGAYSYGLLLFFSRFIGNIFRNYSAEWAFIPAIGTAVLIFRSRIRTLGRFMKSLYLDKKERMRGWLKQPATMCIAILLAIAVFVPLRHDSVVGPFLLEPSQRAIVRAKVPGTVTAVYVSEGQSVTAGMNLMRIRNLKLESRAAAADAEYLVASARATSAQLSYGDLGVALPQQQELREQSDLLRNQAALLQVDTPVRGVVITPRIGDQVGSYVAAGTELAEIADVDIMQARIYVPEYAMKKVRPGSAAKLQFDGLMGIRTGSVSQISAKPEAVAEGLKPESDFKGMQAPQYYTVMLRVANPDHLLRVEMTGTARVYGGRRSIVGLMWQALLNALGRKLW